MADQLNESVNALQLNDTDDATKDAQAPKSNTQQIQFSPEEMYKFALHFYKGIALKLENHIKSRQYYDGDNFRSAVISFS